MLAFLSIPDQGFSSWMKVFFLPYVSSRCSRDASSEPNVLSSTTVSLFTLVETLSLVDVASTDAVLESCS